jgi:hypothetical protein
MSKIISIDDINKMREKLSNAKVPQNDRVLFDGIEYKYTQSNIDKIMSESREFVDSLYLED